MLSYQVKHSVKCNSVCADAVVFFDLHHGLCWWLVQLRLNKYQANVQMDASKVTKPTIKVQQPDKPGSAGSTGSRHRHLGIYRSASPVTSTNEGSNLFLTLPSRSQGGRSLSAASLFNENGAGQNPMSDEKILIK